MNVIKKYPTFVEGLDEMLGNGIPENHIIMISGTAGTMKSSLSYNILYNNAIYNQIKSIYVSLEQNSASLHKQMDKMGFLQKDSKDFIDIIDMGLIRRKIEGDKKLWLDLFKMYVQKLKESSKYELLVIDSLEVLEMVAKFRDYRVELFDLFKWLRNLKLTVILIAEIPQVFTSTFKDLEDMDIFSRHKEGYLVDGIIHVKMVKKGDFEVERRIRVIKMRGTRHSTDWSIITFENNKFQVIPIIST